MGKTCEPKAFSFQCMTKFTTKIKKLKKKICENSRPDSQPSLEKWEDPAKLGGFSSGNKDCIISPAFFSILTGSGNYRNHLFPLSTLTYLRAVLKI